MEVNGKLVQTMAVHGYMPAVQAAKRVGVAVSTIYRAIERGALEGFRAGDSGLWFVRRVSLAAHYGPQVATAVGLNDLLPGEDPNAPPLPAEHAPAKAPGGRSSAPKAKPRAKTAAAKTGARKAPPRGRAKAARR